MKDLRYILGSPIETEVGLLYPIGILDYTLHVSSFDILSITVRLLLQEIDVKEKQLRAEVEKTVKNFDVLIKEDSMFPKIQDLFSLCFKIDKSKIQKLMLGDNLIITLNYDEKLMKEIEIINKKEVKSKEDLIILKNNQDILLNRVVNRDNYDHIRNEILKINNIRLPKQAKNKELQKWFDKDYRAKHNIKNGDSNIDMEDIVVGIMSTLGYTPKEMSEMTVYQINKLIETINKREEFHMNIQFLCVGCKDIKLKSWLEHEPYDKEEKNSTDFNTFMNGTKSMLK